VDNLPNPDALTRAVRSLARAVWVLVALVALMVAYSIWVWIQSTQMVRSLSREGHSSMTSTTSGITPVVGGPRSFSCELPPDDLVRRASAVLLTSYQPSGKGFKAIVAEIVKLEPGTTIEYKVGDEFPDPVTEHPHAGYSDMDGSVFFLEGSPASMRCGYSFHDGRIGGLGDMTLDKLRAIAGKKKP
jgi:hypothetical protein